MAIERRPVGVPMFHQCDDRGEGAEDHQQHGQQQFADDAHPLEGGDARPILPRIHVVSNEHHDWDYPAGDRRQGCAQQVDSIAKEGHQVRDEPRREQDEQDDSVPSSECPLPAVMRVRVLRLRFLQDGHAEYDTFDQVRNEHMDHEACRCDLEGCVKRQIFVHHARALVAHPIVAAKAGDQECCQLERRRQRGIRLRQLHGVLHLRDDLRQHELRGHAESIRAQPRQDTCDGQRADGIPVSIGPLQLLGAGHCVVAQRNQHRAAEGDNVYPNERLVRPHLSRRPGEGPQQQRRERRPDGQAELVPEKQHAEPLPGAQQIDTQQPE
mmetsp:Transcript_109139/g.315329  ORF Transcript_109139/g.315329 Transcript_109139/m.315329 type:complete len:325 (+) Transcript_109139:210-1184(+)